MNNRPAIIVSVVAALFCVAGLFDWPYSFYMVLRCVATGSAVYLLACHSNALPDLGKWALVVIALVFNPIVKVHLGREVWQVVDPATGLIFGWIACCVSGWAPVFTLPQMALRFLGSLMRCCELLALLLSGIAGLAGVLIAVGVVRGILIGVFGWWSGPMPFADTVWMTFWFSALATFGAYGLMAVIDWIIERFGRESSDG